MTRTYTLLSLSAAILLALSPLLVLAHNGIDHSTETEAKAHAQDIQKTAQGARIELKAETRADLKAASTSDEKKGIIRSFVQDRIGIAKDRLASTTALRGVKAAIRWHGGLIRERFVVAFRQFDRIVARIESRIEKLETQGVATASVETELGEAKTAIATAKVDAQAVADFVANIDDSVDRATVKAELQAKIRTAQTSLKAAHRALIETVRALVALKPSASVNATTSVDVSTE